MSDTPRTDKSSIEVTHLNRYIEVIPAKLGRKMEREIAELNRKARCRAKHIKSQEAKIAELKAESEKLRLFTREKVGQ